MAIKGLTDRGLSFAQIGNVRKGDRNGKNGAPRDLTFFRVDFDVKEDAAAKVFKDKYQEHPTEINILLPFNDLESCWDANCEAYTAGRMVARSDGETFSYLVDLRTGAVLVQNGLNAEGKPEAHKEVIGMAGKSVIKCRPVGRLKVIIPELQRLAYLVVHTTSIHDIRNISEQLRSIKLLNGGRIAGIPLVLKRRPKEISVPNEDGSRRRLTKWMLSIEADPRWVAAKLNELNILALPSGDKPALPAVAESEPEAEDGQWEDYDEGSEDIEAGEGFEEEAVVETVPASVPMQDDIPLRYQPERLKARLAEMAATKAGKPVRPEQRGLVAATLEQALFLTTDPKASRKQLLHFLTGKSSLTEIPDPVCLALFAWLNPFKDSGGAWFAEEMATREAVAAFNFCQPQQEGLLI